jgi:hypothetical protein
MADATFSERFWSKVDRSAGPNGCWLWLSSKSTHGYGLARVEGRREAAHRVAWRLSGRTVDLSLTLDHLCRTRACVNPSHLEQVSLRSNILRGTAPSAQNARKTECMNGHQFTPENTRWKQTPKGRARRCKTCEHDRAKREWQRHKEARRV